jgi:hypothetical protein
MFMTYSWNSYKGERVCSEEGPTIVAERILVDLKCCWNGAIYIDLDKKRRFLRFIVVVVRRGDTAQ